MIVLRVTKRTGEGRGVLWESEQDGGGAWGGTKVCLGAAKGRDVTWGAGAGELGSDRLLQTQRERGSPEEETRASLPGLGTGTIGAVGGEH